MYTYNYITIQAYECVYELRRVFPQRLCVIGCVRDYFRMGAYVCELGVFAHVCDYSRLSVFARVQCACG